MSTYRASLNLWILVVCCAGILLPATAKAHKPSFGEDELNHPENAYAIVDPAASIVIYRSVTCEHAELWMKLDGTQDFPLFVQLLTPQIDRLKDYRPSLALVGPGLPAPEADLGIEIPAGMGATVFRTDAVEPVAFDEPFTDTHDWILVEETVKLPMTGTFYVVAWDPDHRTGKLAVAVGTVENFGPADFANAAEWTKKTRTFHETSDYPPASATTEMVCDAEQMHEHSDDHADASVPTMNAANTGNTAATSSGGGGCWVSPSRGPGSVWWAVPAALLLVRRAKRKARTGAR
jgi:hypothetical protein